MTHEINPETGLPTLPDGYRWRVFRDTRPAQFGDLPLGMEFHWFEGAYRTRHVSKLLVAVEKFEPARDKTENVMLTEERTVLHWFRPDEFFSAVYETKTTHFNEKWTIVDETSIEAITEENILTAALYIMERRDAEAKIDSLMGTYPPNRIGVSE